MTGRMYAYVTTQGTAMPEATLCERCRLAPKYPPNQATALQAAQGSPDWDKGAMQDATGNPELACIICGAKEGPVMATYLVVRVRTEGVGSSEHFAQVRYARAVIEGSAPSENLCAQLDIVFEGIRPRPEWDRP